MRIHLLRHGIAIDRDDPACPPDPKRFLTPKGAERTRAACRGWAELGARVDRIFVSPYVRARETAQIAMDVLGLVGHELDIIDSLVPFGDPQQVVETIGRCLDTDSVLCVGHAPNLDSVIAALLGLRSPITRLKKAGVATLDVDSRGRGQLVALHPPRLLRTLGAV